MEIYLIRHSRVSVALNVCYGASDVELHENSENDIENIFDQLPKIENSKFYSSPLTRCKKLAESLTQSEIIFDDRLKELNFGDWELKIWEEIPEKEFNLWKNDYVQNSPRNGESYQELANRVKEFWNEKILTDKSNKIIISHGGVIRAILADILNLNLKDAFKVKIDFGSMSMISVDREMIHVNYINR